MNEKGIKTDEIKGVLDAPPALLRVLRKLELVCKNSIVKLRGRLVSEFNTEGEGLMIQIVFQNVVQSMEANTTSALCSPLVFGVEYEDPIANNLEPMKAFDTMKVIARKVAEVMPDNKVTIGVEERVATLKLQLMDALIRACC